MATRRKRGGGGAPRIRGRKTWGALGSKRSGGAGLTSQPWRRAKAAIATGAPTATKICQREGGGVPVLRGMYAKRNAMAKQARNPSTCARGWKLERNPTERKIGT